MTKEIKDLIYEYGKIHYSSADLVFNEIEFKRDIDKIFTTKKMITRFLNSGYINEKLLINNIIIVLNVLGPKPTTKIFRMATDDNQYSIIKTILKFLNVYDPDYSENEIEDNEIFTNILKDIKMRYNLPHV